MSKARRSLKNQNLFLRWPSIRRVLDDDIASVKNGEYEGQ